MQRSFFMRDDRLFLSISHEWKERRGMLLGPGQGECNVTRATARVARTIYDQMITIPTTRATARVRPYNIRSDDYDSNRVLYGRTLAVALACPAMYCTGAPLRSPWHVQ